MFKKAKLYSLLFIIVASTAVGLLNFTSVAAQTPDDQGFASGALTQSFKNKTYVEVMRQCLAQIAEIVPGSNDVYDESDFQNESWLRTASVTDLRVGYLIDPNDDGKIGCAGEAATIIAEYKKATDYPTPTDMSPYDANIHFACTLGFIPADVSLLNSTSDISIDDCVAAAENDSEVEYVFPKENIPPRVPADGNLFTDAERYLAYRFAFLTQCQVQNRGFSVDGEPISDDNIQWVAIVYENGTSRFVNYHIGRPDHNVSTQLTDHEGGKGKNYLCRELPELMKQTHSAYKDWLTSTDRPDNDEADNTVSPPQDVGGGGASESNCQVDGIGWLVCPVVNLLARMADELYILLDSSLLRTQPVTFNNTDNQLYKSWKLMRDFANIIFVIGFLIIVFSQITSFGINNYGIKRLLPKLIISAILVNLSYFICALAVDVSNILGSSLKDLIENASGVDDIMQLGSGVANGQGTAGNIGWGVIATGALGAGALAGGGWAVLAFLIPLLFTALMSVITVVIILILRQVVLVLLIVVSPLAFVALLLPNTESYFKKWKTLFQAMLLLYPIVAIIFGASALASEIVMFATSNDNSAVVNTLNQLAGACIAFVPLILTPLAIKTASGALSRIAGIVNNPNKGPIDGLKNKAMAGVEDQQTRHDLAATRGKNVYGGRKIKKRNMIEAKRSSIKQQLGSAQSQSLAKNIKENEGLAREMAGGSSASKSDITKVRASAISSNLSESGKEIQAIQTTLLHDEGAENLDKIGELMVKAAKEGDEGIATVLAAQNILLTKGGSKGIEQYRSSVQEIEKEDGATESKVMNEVRRNVLEEHPGIKNDAKDVMEHALQKEKRDENGVVTPRKSLTEISKDKLTWDMSDEQLVKQKSGSLIKALEANAIDQTRAERIAGNDDLAKNLPEDIRNQFNNIAANLDRLHDPPAKPPQPARSTAANQATTPTQPAATPTANPTPATTQPATAGTPTVTPQQTTPAAATTTPTQTPQQPAGWNTSPSGIVYPQGRSTPSSTTTPPQPAGNSTSQPPSTPPTPTQGPLKPAGEYFSRRGTAQPQGEPTPSSTTTPPPSSTSQAPPTPGIRPDDV